MRAIAEQKYTEPPPSSIVESPSEKQEGLLELFDAVGTDSPNANKPGKKLFVRRRAGRSVELAQIVDGSVSYLSIETPDLVEIIEADDFDGGVIEGVVDGWWKTNQLCRPVTGVIDDEEKEARAQEIISVAHGTDHDGMHAHHPTPRVELSQKTGKGDVHTIVATKLDLARAVVIAQTEPAAKRLVGDVPGYDSSDSAGLSEIIRDRETTALFGYSRIKDVAMDVSPPGRVRALLAVAVLCVLSVFLALIRIQTFGAVGISHQLMIVGQHIGVTASIVPVGLAALSVLQE